MDVLIGDERPTPYEGDEVEDRAEDVGYRVGDILIDVIDDEYG